jgi:hypothetical protein
LSAEDVDQWLTTESRQCSTRTLRLLHSILSRSIRNAQARDKVRRNVVLLCDVPTRRKGRPSKALTLSQATAVINAAAESRLYAYIVLSLLIGARTEELRALRWCYVDLSGSPGAAPPVPPSISVLRSVRDFNDFDRIEFLIFRDRLSAAVLIANSVKKSLNGLASKYDAMRVDGSYAVVGWETETSENFDEKVGIPWAAYQI